MSGESPTVMRSNWFETFFHGVALDLWRKIINPEQTNGEADFLQKQFGSKVRLLDAPCGNGRHSMELARRGCRITGLDISAEFIQEARAQSAKEKLHVEWVQGDMRRLDWRD